MFAFQFSKTGEKRESAHSPAQKKVQGWFAVLRGRFLSAAKKLF